MTATPRTFALITPQSEAAVQSFRHPDNSAIVYQDSQSRLPTIALKFDDLFGRCCMTLGSTSRCDITIPHIAPCHLRIRFEMRSGVLLLTDTSADGTRISARQSTQDVVLLCNKTQVLTKKTLIALGEDFKYQFCIKIIDFRTTPSLFRDLFRQYAQSIGKALPHNLVGPSAPIVKVLTEDRRYVSFANIQEGGFGSVSLCLRTSDGSVFAAKQPKEKRNNVQRTLLQEEALIHRKLKHPNIVVFIEQVDSALIMEYVPKGTLADLLDTGKLLVELSIKKLVRQCLQAVQYLESQDIMHNDIKPQNILIHSEEPIRIKICDLGGALNKASLSSCLEPRFIGTRAYMAPEFGSKDHFFGIDVWAVGIVALNCLGHWPWNHQLDNGKGAVTDEYSHMTCADLLDGMLKRDPQDRLKAGDCLQHPWLQLATADKHQFGTAVKTTGKTCLKRLKPIESTTISASRSNFANRKSSIVTREGRAGSPYLGFIASAGRRVLKFWKRD